jgi:hypothetical protein
VRRTLALVCVLFFAAAGTAAAIRVPPIPPLSGPWSHAEINVTIGGVPHTLILDRGRIVRATPGAITLRERDGSRVAIRLTRRTIVRVDGLRALPLDLRVGMRAVAMRIDGGPAVRVRAV